MGLCDVMQNAMKRYRDLILIDQRAVKASNLDVLTYVYIEVEHFHECGYPRHGDDETYNITVIHENPAKILARTVWGALRALETFSQLVYENEATKEYLINVTHISDFPRYKFRAMHLDTARHFIPKKVIYANLDAMAYNKFNVFHWHIIDDQSFPFESKQYPEITAKSAYTRNHVYTQKDVYDIIEYARMRGIRVIPEIDTPGHTHAIGKAFPELLTPCYGEGPTKPYTPRYPDFSPTEILNPMKNQTYTFMKELFREFKQTFKDDFIHLGKNNQIK
jgi:hexosaminidase